MKEQIIRFTSKIKLSNTAYNKICLILSEEGINASELTYQEVKKDESRKY